MTGPNLTHRDRTAAWLDTAWLSALAITCLLTGDRLMQSAAWQRVIELIPGGRTTAVTVITIAAAGALVSMAIRMPRGAWPWFALAAAWCFAIAAFQLYSAVNDDTGPLGFFAWGYVAAALIRRASRISA